MCNGLRGSMGIFQVVLLYSQGWEPALWCQHGEAGRECSTTTGNHLVVRVISFDPHEHLWAVEIMKSVFIDEEIEAQRSYVTGPILYRDKAHSRGVEPDLPLHE